MITFIVIGNEIQRIPKIGKLLQFPRSATTQEALSQARISAGKQVTTEFFSIVDGGPDILLPDFEDSVIELCLSMNEFGMNIGTARETLRGHPSILMHHGVVCRTTAFNKLELPDRGCFCFDQMVYRMLSENGVAISHKFAYDWIPSVNGARLWHETPRAKLNGRRWAMGLPPISSGLDRNG
jgi:hypothetical protein